MPIGTTVVYNAGDLILSTVSSSGNTFQENKIAAATSSIILFNSNGLISSQSLSSTNVGTSSYFSGSTIIVSNLTASNISASGNTRLNTLTASSLIATNGPLIVTGSNAYLQLFPVGGSPIPTSTTASYIYTSGSTNDLYFTQYQGVFTNTTRLRWLEGNLYTGILYGGQLTSTVGSTTFNIKSGSGLIVSMNATTGSDPYPTVKLISWPNYNNTPITNSGSAKITYVGLDNTGAIVQQTNAWGSTDINQWDTQINLGVVLHLSGSVSTGVFNSPQISYGYPQKTDDFTRAFGPLKVSGHTLQSSGSTTLSIQKTGGTSFREGANYYINPNHPSTVIENAITSSKIYRYYISGSTPVIDTGVGAAGYTALDNTQYVDTTTGTLTSATSGGGNNKFTIQRIFWVPNSPTNAFLAYYGNAVYTTLIDATNATNTEPFTEAPNTSLNAIFVAYVIMEASATNFTNTGTGNTTYIQQGGLFRSVGGVGSGGTTPIVTSLDSLSDVAINSPTQGDLLIYGNGTQWVNSKTLSGSYGLTGSLNATLNITASAFTGSFTGSLNGTSSWATNSLTASNLVIANSYKITNLTASSISASSFTGSFSGSISNATSASFSTTSSFATTAATANALNTANSYQLTNLTASNIISIGVPANFHNIYIQKPLVVGTNYQRLHLGTRWYFDATANVWTSSVQPNTDNPDWTAIDSMATYLSFKVGSVTGSTTSLTTSSYDANERFRITTGGAILSTSGSDTELRIVNNDSVNDPKITFYSSSVANWVVGVDDSEDDKFKINQGSLLNASNVITINTGSNVGIGITNPVNRFDVAGNISASVITASLFSGSHSGSTFGTSSWATNALTASNLVIANNYQITNLTASNISSSGNISASIFVGFLTGSTFGTSSWSTNATTATTANALNTANTYTVSGLNINTGNLTMGSGTEILLSDGDQTTPGLAFSADTNTGIYRVTNDTIGFTTNGTLKFDINNTNISSSIPISASLFVGPITGSVFGTSSWATTSSNVLGGTNGYVARWTGATSLGSGLIRDDGSQVAINAAPNNVTLLESGKTFTTDSDNEYFTHKNSTIFVGTGSGYRQSFRANSTISSSGTMNAVSDFLSYDMKTGAGTLSIVDQFYAGGYNFSGSITTRTGFKVKDWTILSPASIATNVGFSVENLSGTTAYGLLSTISSGANKWNLYVNGTADNYFAGKIGIGITTPVNKLDVVGNISASVITASLFSGSLSGSVFGTSSWASNALSATSATTATTANALNTGNSYTIAGLTVNGNISSSGNISASVFVGAHTGSTFGTSSWSSNSVTASYLIPSNSYTISNLTASNISASGAVIASSFTGSFSGSISNATSASYALSSSFATTATTATTANALNTANNYQVTNLYATGNITASNVSASAISSSGLFASSGVVSGQLTVESGFTTNGSTILGNNQANTVLINPASSTTINSPNIRLTGSVVLTGSLSVINISASSYMSASVFVGAHTGSTFGTSSWASNVVSALTASYLSTANSYQITNLTASNISASGAVIASSFTGSFSGSISNATSASYALSSSFATTATTANALNTANTYTVSGLNINTGNLTMGSATEILLSDGDQTAPGLAFSADTNTGIYRVANDRIGFTTNGTLKFDINASDISSSIPISASLFVGPVTGSVFGTSSWASNVVSALTASYLTPSNSYLITNLTASNISASNTITALNLVETSTAAVKTNIVPLSSQLNKIIKLNPVSFNYIFNNEPSFGLIAEEVGEIYPEFTTKEKNAISYGKMVSVLIQSIKELKEIVDCQQKEIDKLKDK